MTDEPRETPETPEPTAQGEPAPAAAPAPAVESAPSSEAAPASPPDAEPAAEAPSPPPPPPARRSFLAERPEVAIEIPRRKLVTQSRRDFLMLAAGTVVTAAGAWWLLPDGTKARLLGMAGRESPARAARVARLSRAAPARRPGRAPPCRHDAAGGLSSTDR